MHRPLRIPFHLRVWNLIKGVLLRNTVDWQRASDGLNMPTLTREERERSRPQANLDIIRPRDKPRARLDAFKGGEVSKPLHEETQVSEPDSEKGAPINPYTGRVSAPAEPLPSVEGETYVKRRRYKRRRTNSSQGGDGFFRRVFGK